MTRPLADSLIASQLAAYGIVPSTAQCDCIRAYIDILLRWNHSMSLTTVTAPSEIVRFHFGESIFAISEGLIDKGRLADVGSGAGFPGVPLAIFSEKLDVILIESSSKKAAFLAEVKRSLGLANIRILRERFENIEVDTRFDFVVARALGQHEDLLRWSLKNLAPRGRTCLWLGLNDAQRIALIPEWTWMSPRQIPGSLNRAILTGKPAR